MNQQQVNSFLRELFTLAGGVLATFSIGENIVGVLAGFAVQAAMLGWAIRSKAGIDVVKTIARKAIQAAAPAAVALDWLKPDQATALAQLVAFGVSGTWGAIDSAPEPPKKGLP